jgi:hypothetical protein
VRPLYRARQFWQALFAEPAPSGLEQARQVLPSSLLALFEVQQPCEQAHCLRILEMLLAAGEDHPDLFTAALLHDIGKNRYPLRLWERVLIVIAQALLPEQVKVWGQGKAVGLRRAFVVAVNHPDWGAEIAQAAGCTPLTVGLIRRHQEPISQPPLTLEDQLLLKLQQYDDWN